jgi:alginate O-acetyltransferase complex protein AlgI
MNYSSLIFLFYFVPLFLFVYNLIPKGKRNLTIFLGSYVFLCWGSPQSALLLLSTSVLDYFLGRLIASSPLQGRRRLWVSIGVIENVGVLFYFKYWNFFIQEFNYALSLMGLNSIVTVNVLLPLGISFFTFHKMSYLLDVYRNKVQPAGRFADFALYVALFPKLIQGPIVPYQHFSPQLPDHGHDINDTFEGLFRFCIGLGKKVLIADILGEAADNVFQLKFGSMACGYAWLGILCYTFQIYKKNLLNTAPALLGG